MIESRGRTGRKPSAAEKGSTSSRGGGGGGGGGSSGGRRNRYDKPPTWKGSLVRAVIAAVIVYGLSTFLLGKHTNATNNLLLVPIVLALYTPMIFYTDQYMYRRRLRRQSTR
jgi:hypothetical protein